MTGDCSNISLFITGVSFGLGVGSKKYKPRFSQRKICNSLNARDYKGILNKGGNIVIVGRL